MKKFNFAYLFLIFLFSCGTEPSTPSEVAEAYFTSLSDGDFKKAESYSTPDGIKMVRLMKGFYIAALESDDEDVPNFTFFGITEEEINGDSAIVKYKEKEDGNVQSLNLVKINGSWKVDFKKD